MEGEMGKTETDALIINSAGSVDVKERNGFNC
jgi:hypothetical protein